MRTKPLAMLGVAVAALVVALVSVARADGPATRPATSPAADAPRDILYGFIDPYDQGLVRTEFLRVAGVDTEMSREELSGATKAASVVAQQLGRWDDMVKFDKNATKTLDWPEYEAYCLDLRARVLAAFDVDNDVKLVGRERELAIASVLTGTIPISRAPSPADPAAKTGLPASTRPAEDKPLLKDATPAQKEYLVEATQSWEDEKKRSDANHDGIVTQEEFHAAMKERAARHIKAFDLDGDGKLSIAEARRSGALWMQQTQESNLARYDSNQNGKIDGDEAKQRSEDMNKKVRELTELFTLWRYDINKNNKWEPEELDKKKQEEEKMAKSVEELKRKNIAKYDADGDGSISSQELAQYKDKIRKKYDLNGDGKIDAEELKKVPHEDFTDAALSAPSKPATAPKGEQK